MFRKRRIKRDKTRRIKSFSPSRLSHVLGVQNSENSSVDACALCCPRDLSGHTKLALAHGLVSSWVERIECARYNVREEPAKLSISSFFVPLFSSGHSKYARFKLKKKKKPSCWIFRAHSSRSIANLFSARSIFLFFCFPLLVSLHEEWSIFKNCRQHAFKRNSLNTVSPYPDKWRIVVPLSTIYIHF